MSKLIKFLVLCAILVFSYGSDCPSHDVFLSHPGNSLVYTRLKNGTLTAESITCPQNNIFSATELKCVEVLEMNVKCTQSGRFLDTTSTNCTTYLICTQLEDGNYTSKHVTCPTGTLFSPNVSRCVSINNYTCPGTHENLQSSGCQSKGRVTDPNSLNCSSYLLCTQLENGRYTSTKVICPPGTIFSSNISRCISDTNYTCPGLNNVPHNHFQSRRCQASGRFPDSISSNCSSYIICTQLKDGNYSSNQVNCPPGTLFSPNVSRCISSTNYKCPTTKNETHENLQSSECHAKGRFPHPSSKNCSSYQICTQLDDGTYFSNQVTCPIGTLFSSIVNRCVTNSSYICPGNQNETHTNFQSNRCRGNGRFLDPNSINCSSYLICTQMENGSYSSTRVICPSGTIFSSNISRCISSTSYTCPIYKNETHENFQDSGCHSNGRFSDPTSSNCSSYLICTQLENGNYSSNQVICPSGTLFSSNETRCVPSQSYVCPTTKNELDGNFHSSGCHSNGRFPDPSSTNCTTYQICTQLDDGNYSSNQVACPTGTLFSSLINRCVTNSSYICPGNRNETHENLQVSGCRENGRFPDLNSSNCSSYLICTKLEDGKYTSSQVTCPFGTVFSPYVSRCVLSSEYSCRSCSSEGLFSDPNATDCSTYISCSAELVPEKLKCPQYTLFSIEKQQCIIACDVTCHVAQ